MTFRNALEFDGITGEATPIPTPKGSRYRCKLDTASDCKREMSRVYRESRSGLIDPQDASKQVWMLQSIARVIETSEIEKRIEALEENSNGHKR